jgi:Leucine-rich repeat (LRR) protein
MGALVTKVYDPELQELIGGGSSAIVEVADVSAMQAIDARVGQLFSVLSEGSIRRFEGNGVYRFVSTNDTVLPYAPYAYFKSNPAGPEIIDVGQNRSPLSGNGVSAIANGNKWCKFPPSSEGALLTDGPITTDKDSGFTIMGTLQPDFVDGSPVTYGPIAHGRNFNIFLSDKPLLKTVQFGLESSFTEHGITPDAHLDWSWIRGYDSSNVDNFYWVDVISGSNWADHSVQIRFKGAGTNEDGGNYKIKAGYQESNEGIGVATGSANGNFLESAGDYIELGFSKAGFLEGITLLKFAEANDKIRITIGSSVFEFDRDSEFCESSVYNSSARFIRFPQPVFIDANTTFRIEAAGSPVPGSNNFILGAIYFSALLDRAYDAEPHGMQAHLHVHYRDDLSNTRFTVNGKTNWTGIISNMPAAFCFKGDVGSFQEILTRVWGDADSAKTYPDHANGNTVSWFGSLMLWRKRLSDDEESEMYRYLASEYYTPCPVSDAYESLLGVEQIGNETTGEPSANFTSGVHAAACNAYASGCNAFKFAFTHDAINKWGVSTGIAVSLSELFELSDFRKVFDIPFKTTAFWMSSFAGENFMVNEGNGGGRASDGSGLTSAFSSSIYDEVYAFVTDVLTAYADTDRVFYAGNWEGDWMMAPDHDDSTQTTASHVATFLDWVNIRGLAIKDAKDAFYAANPNATVQFYYYLEVNKLDWAANGETCVTLDVLPNVANLDYVSLTAFHLNNQNRTTVQNWLDVLVANLPAGVAPNQNIIVGEIGTQANAVEGLTWQSEKDWLHDQFNNLWREDIKEFFIWKYYDDNNDYRLADLPTGKLNSKGKLFANYHSIFNRIVSEGVNPRDAHVKAISTAPHEIPVTSTALGGGSSGGGSEPTITVADGDEMQSIIGAGTVNVGQLFKLSSDGSLMRYEGNGLTSVVSFTAQKNPYGYITFKVISTAMTLHKFGHDQTDGASGFAYSINGGSPSFVSSDGNGEKSISIPDYDGAPVEVAVWPASSASSGRKGNFTLYESHFQRVSELNAAGLSELKNLRCSSSDLTSIVLSGCTSLESVDVSQNPALKSISVAGLPSLKEIDCYNCSLKSIDLSGCTALETVNLGRNDLQVLKIENVPSCTKVEAGDNNLKTLIIRNAPLVILIDGFNNQINFVEITGTPALTHLRLQSNEITEFDVSAFPALEQLDIYGNQLQSIDVSQNPALEQLNIYDNQISGTLDLSNNSSLIEVRCQDNQLSGITGLPAGVGKFHCSNNQISGTLDLSGMAVGSSIRVEGNLITSLIIPLDFEPSHTWASNYIPHTGGLTMWSNPLDGAALNAIYSRIKQGIVPYVGHHGPRDNFTIWIADPYDIEGTRCPGWDSDDPSIIPQITIVGTE